MERLACKRKLISFITLCVLSLPAFPATGHMYGGASLAASFANIGKSSPQITYFSGVPIRDDYPVSGRDASAAMFSLNGGYEYEGDNWIPAIALGLGFYTTPVDFDYNGHVIETVTGDAPSTLYKYSYDLNSTRVMAEVQFTWLMKNISPFISFGAGPSWNKMSGYTETPVTSTGFVAQPPFRSNTNVNFAYQLGFGLSTAFNYAHPACDFLQDRISIGYHYVNLGQTSFRTRGSTYPFSLKTGLLTTNDIYISYTHLF